ncbi:MAG: hypothetical protein P8L77_01940 [Gammaproteobacteria bacterium]|nr:hypothetical protein [Gammaproteobacteria bacterium]
MLQENNILVLNESATFATVVWLHGLGASPDDFTFFGKLFPNIKWILPGAYSRFISLYQQEAPGWFDIKSFDRQDDPQETGIIETHQRLEHILETEKANPIFIGGFSQGAAQSIYSGLHGLQSKVQGIIAMSGYCPFNFSHNNAPPTLIMHGEYDDVVPWSLAEATYHGLLALPTTSLYMLPCAHQWHPEMYSHINNFIKNTA